MDDEARLRELFVHSPAAVCILRGPDLRVVFASDKVAQATGAELLGRPLWDVFPELKVPNMEAMLRHIFEDGGAFHVEELEVQVRLGEPEPLRSFRGDCLAWRRWRHRWRRRLRLRHQQRRRTHAPGPSKKWSSGRVSLINAKTSFIAMLGHELRNPLGPARTALVLASEALERKENPATYLKVV